ncbi:hypothetical protein X975_09666, partial [Stegodyphus mimosarum]
MYHIFQHIVHTFNTKNMIEIYEYAGCKNDRLKIWKKSTYKSYIFICTYAVYLKEMTYLLSLETFHYRITSKVHYVSLLLYLQAHHRFLFHLHLHCYSDP